MLRVSSDEGSCGDNFNSGLEYPENNTFGVLATSTKYDV
jgi:hypothetical protein